MLPNPLDFRLRDLNLQESVISDYQILCLPENFFSGEIDELYDASHAILLSKMLKQKGVKCANSYDLGFESEVYIRQSGDLYLGLVYILEELAIPFFVSVLAALVVQKINSDEDRLEEKNSSNVNIDLYLPKDKHLKYTGDSETLLEILRNLKGD